MKVGELVKQLLKLDQERLVVLSSDEEGNNFSPLDDSISEGAYQADSTYSGQFGLEKLTKRDKEDGFEEEDVVDGVKAICLYPINWKESVDGKRVSIGLV